MRIVVNDIAASKTGALAILLDFYEYVKNNCQEHEWIFLTGIDCIKNPPPHISVRVMDHVKRSQKDRLKFDLLDGSAFLESLEPDIIISLQNTLTRGKIRRKKDLVITENCCGKDCKNSAKKSESVVEESEAVAKESENIEKERLVAKKGDLVKQVLYVHQPLGFQKTKRFSFIKKEEREYAVYQYLIGSLIDASVKRADKVIVQTAWMKQAVAEKTGKPLSKIVQVLPDIADVTKYKNYDKFNCRHFFFPSGEILYKNHECVLKAARILNEKGITDFKVHFTLKNLSDVTERKYDDPYNNIIWSGRVSREEVLKEYSAGTLLFPSYIETFGVPLAEGRQIGTLILASDCPFCHEVLEGYDNARYFDPFDEKQLADLMELVIEGKLQPNDGEKNTVQEAEAKGQKSEDELKKTLFKNNNKWSENSYGQLVDEMPKIALSEIKTKSSYGQLVDEIVDTLASSFAN